MEKKIVRAPQPYPAIPTPRVTGSAAVLGNTVPATLPSPFQPPLRCDSSLGGPTPAPGSADTRVTHSTTASAAIAIFNKLDGEDTSPVNARASLMVQSLVSVNRRYFTHDDSLNHPPNYIIVLNSTPASANAVAAPMRIE